jgi:hypothetical protein
MRRLVLLLALAASLLASGSALAWDGVTVQMSAVPAGLGPGDPWDANLTVLDPAGNPFAHPSESPAVVIREPATGATKTFPATPATGPGQFHVRIVFPHAGTWTYRADVVRGDSGAPSTSYPAVTIGLPNAPSGGLGTLALALAVAGGTVLAAIGLLAARRFRRRGPATI